jgi:hypothetical protein
MIYEFLLLREKIALRRERLTPAHWSEKLEPASTKRLRAGC